MLRIEKPYHTCLQYFLVCSIVFSVTANDAKPSLKELSEEFNSSLPKDYDPLTKLLSTNVEDGKMVFNFAVFFPQRMNWSLTRVKTESLKTICSKDMERKVLTEYKNKIVYRYKSITEETIGFFQVRPDHCLSLE